MICTCRCACNLHCAVTIPLANSVTKQNRSSLGAYNFIYIGSWYTLKYTFISEKLYYSASILFKFNILSKINSHQVGLVKRYKHFTIFFDTQFYFTFACTINYINYLVDVESTGS